MKKVLVVLSILALAFQASFALAKNTPCSGEKGGVSKCDGDKFICRDGTTSKSKQICTSDLAKQYKDPKNSPRSTASEVKEVVLEPVLTSKRGLVCSGSKGGVSKCDGDKFVCNDGSTSTSKQVCTKDLVNEYKADTKDISKKSDSVKKEVLKSEDKNNEPVKGRSVCAGKKGGVSKCDGDKFVCNDGSTSSSKQICSSSLLNEYKKGNTIDKEIKTPVTSSNSNKIDPARQRSIEELPANLRSICKGNKGGISKCDGDKFVCNDGSTSSSKQICSASLLKEYKKGNTTDKVTKTPITSNNSNKVDPARQRSIEELPANLRSICKGNKGGISKCDGDKFVCNDGSTSSSKQVCSSSLLKEYKKGLSANKEVTQTSITKNNNESKSSKGRSVCAGKKGGVSKCDGEKFVCNDGTTSTSKQICTAELVKEYK